MDLYTAEIAWLPWRGTQDTPIFLGTFPRPLLFWEWRTSFFFLKELDLLSGAEDVALLLHNKAIAFSGLHSSRTSAVVYHFDSYSYPKFRVQCIDSVRL